MTEDRPDGQSSNRPARTSTAAWCLLAMVIALGLGLDLWSKHWAFANVAGVPVQVDRVQVLTNTGYSPIPHHDAMVAIDGRMLNFQLVLNSGAVFGIGAQHRWFFISFSIVAVCIAVWIFGWRTDARSRWLHLGIGMILAGAMGNLWDRLMYGRVRDFLHMLPERDLPWGISWPGGNSEVWPWVFNVADVLLLAGMAVVLVYLHVEDRRARRASRAANPA